MEIKQPKKEIEKYLKMLNDIFFKKNSYSGANSQIIELKKQLNSNLRTTKRKNIFLRLTENKLMRL